MPRLLSIPLLVLLSCSAFAQTLSYEALEAAQCTIEEATQGWRVQNATNEFRAPYLLISTVGTVSQREGFPIAENETVTVYVYGKQSVISDLRVRRTSNTRDPNEVRYTGTAASRSVLSAMQTDPCAIEVFQLGDFASSVGSIVVETRNASGGWDKLSDYSFSVLALFRGSVSFGPLASRLPTRAYAAVIGDDGASRLARTEGGRFDVQYAFLFTYHLFGPRTRDNAGNLGLFLALPISGPFGDNAYAGLSFDLGTIFVANVGIRFGKVDRLIESQERYLVPDGDGRLPVLPDGFAVTTESEWKPALAFGVSIDAGAAAQAFGSIIGNLGGD